MTMDMEGLINQMRESQKRSAQHAAMTGIPKDYVCVIHPRHRRTLELINNDNTMAGTPDSVVIGMWGRLGVQIYEENRAPEDKFEFMSLLTYYQKYPPIFPKQYSRRYILWDNFSTMIRRQFICFRYWITKR